MTTKRLSILIADDELPARKKLLSFLSQQAEPADIYEAADGLEAYRIIVELNPDIVFLDVQMPGMTGLEVLENLSVRCYPHIIFVTAYDQYAVKAFEINAVDYLLKPFDGKRFNIAYKRAVEKFRQKANNDDGLTGFLNEIKKDKKYADRLLVNKNGKYLFVPIDEVIY
ncbi:MAG: LytR/AlgR family response regulator transcription factor, partial [Syntrophothermus sp.]